MASARAQGGNRLTQLNVKGRIAPWGMPIEFRMLASLPADWRTGCERPLGSTRRS